MLYIGNSRIALHHEKFIRNMILFKHFNYLVCDLKTNQVLICHKEGLLKTSANSFYRDCLPAACSEIRGSFNIILYIITLHFYFGKLKATVISFICS